MVLQLCLYSYQCSGSIFRYFLGLALPVNVGNNYFVYFSLFVEPIDLPTDPSKLMGRWVSIAHVFQKAKEKISIGFLFKLIPNNGSICQYLPIDLFKVNMMKKYIGKLVTKPKKKKCENNDELNYLAYDITT